MGDRHKRFSFKYNNCSQIIISSDFDSGNLQNVQYRKNNVFAIYPSFDPFNPTYSYKVSSKTFFHFKVQIATKQQKPPDSQLLSYQQQNPEQSPKTTNNSIKLRFVIQRMKILSSFIGSDNSLDAFEQYFYICVKQQNKNRINSDTYLKIKPKNMKLNYNDGQYGDSQASLEFNFEIHKNCGYYFAYHYPYPYNKLKNFLQNFQCKINSINKKRCNKFTNLQSDEINQISGWDEQIKQQQQNQLSSNFINNEYKELNIFQQLTTPKSYIYYRNQQLIQSHQNRPIQLLTLTAIDESNIKIDPNNQFFYHVANIDVNLGLENKIDKNLFPLYEIQSRPYKFSNKPYVFISCRVHPGQTSASYTLQGLLQFLLSQNQIAEQLLKLFVFIIVPMINPDGVYHGHYRMDTSGQNLNRFYNSSQSTKQPAVFGITHILNAYAERIVYYMDMHSHPIPNKGSFFYGNSFNLIHQQMQSQLFAKLLSKNHQLFSYNSSSFSPYQMASKDLNETMSKQGCGRVYAYRLLNKMFGGIHCYTLQVGYHGLTTKKNQKVIFDTDHYKQLGKKILETLHEIYRITYCQYYIMNNPVIILNEQQKQMQNIRQQLVKDIYDKQQKFKLISQGIYRQVKNAPSTILRSIYAKLFNSYPIFQTIFKRYIIQQHYPQKQLKKDLTTNKKNNIIIKNISRINKSKDIVAKNRVELIEMLDRRINDHSSFQGRIQKSLNYFVHHQFKAKQLRTKVRNKNNNKSDIMTFVNGKYIENEEYNSQNKLIALCYTQKNNNSYQFQQKQSPASKSKTAKKRGISNKQQQMKLNLKNINKYSQKLQITSTHIQKLKFQEEYIKMNKNQIINQTTEKNNERDTSRTSNNKYDDCILSHEKNFCQLLGKGFKARSDNSNPQSPHRRFYKNKFLHSKINSFEQYHNYQHQKTTQLNKSCESQRNKQQKIQNQKLNALYSQIMLIKKTNTTEKQQRTMKTRHNIQNYIRRLNKSKLVEQQNQQPKQKINQQYSDTNNNDTNTNTNMSNDIKFNNKEQQLSNSHLPKIICKTQSIKQKYEMQLKIQRNYQKQYKIEKVQKRNRRKKNNNMQMKFKEFNNMLNNH